MKKIVILTGAGVSAESGIATFRDSNGLWENHRVEDVASPEGFARDQRWYFTSIINGARSCTPFNPMKGIGSLPPLKPTMK